VTNCEMELSTKIKTSLQEQGASNVFEVGGLPSPRMETVVPPKSLVLTEALKTLDDLPPIERAVLITNSVILPIVTEYFGDVEAFIEETVAEAVADTKLAGVFEFTEKPGVKNLGNDKYEITFVVKGNCDVTV
jgi:hypothetical protein